MSKNDAASRAARYLLIEREGEHAFRTFQLITQCPYRSKHYRALWEKGYKEAERRSKRIDKD